MRAVVREKGVDTARAGRVTQATFGDDHCVTHKVAAHDQPEWLTPQFDDATASGMDRRSIPHARRTEKSETHDGAFGRALARRARGPPFQGTGKARANVRWLRAHERACRLGAKGNGRRAHVDVVEPVVD
jgi:hypothetical protein